MSAVSEHVVDEDDAVVGMPGPELVAVAGESGVVGLSTPTTLLWLLTLLLLNLRGL